MVQLYHNRNVNKNSLLFKVDYTSALDQEIENYKIQLRKLYHNKDTILSDMDSLDYEDKHYQRRKTGIIKVVEGLPNLLRVFREGLA